MADNILCIGWNRPVTGRDSTALETYTSFTNWLGKQQQMGNIESFEPVMLDPTGTNLNGFILVRGTRAGLDKVRASNEFQDQTTRANFSLDGFRVINGYTGQALVEQMNRYQKLVGTTTGTTR